MMQLQSAMDHVLVIDVLFYRLGKVLIIQNTILTLHPLKGGQSHVYLRLSVVLVVF